ncbi:threonine synthase [Geminicoccaceae bacterium SYSU G07066]|uniref:Threonine synthase n=1 Tax=Benzoatithermus flavus TaxID=3108223 RepID=A0ABU8XU40_9PROT
MITYISTRGQAGRRSFEDVLLAGLAEDGGLFVPEIWPTFGADELRAMRGLDYPSLAARLLAPFTEGCFGHDELLGLARKAYASFDHAATAPLRHLAGDDWLLELFHGPTLAFKDFAMQLLAVMFDEVLSRRGQQLTIVGATSGDTGAAAVHAFAGKRQIRIAMLHPEGRISPVQRRQMTTVRADNVLNIALRGTFDDCQDLVKAMFNDAAFRQRMRLSAVNSINWARVVAQVVYYVWAALRLGAPDRPVAFTVPTGNFGNVYAGRVAAAIGLPVAKLVVATNENDILARFFQHRRYERGTVVPTTSPSMDIQVASNFERLLLELEGGDTARTRARMQAFAQSGAFALETLGEVAHLFAGGTADQGTVAETIAATLHATGELVDPHTAVALAVAVRHRPLPGVPMVSLATAHPAKFPDAVRAATGIVPDLPARYADLMTRPERCVSLDNDLHAVETAVCQQFGAA